MMEPVQGELVVVQPERQADDPGMLIARAVERGMPVEALDKLLAMRRQLQEERARNAFYEALAAFQAECPVIPKTREVKGKDGKTRYYFCPLGDIVKIVGPLLAKHGFSYRLAAAVQPPTMLVTCIATHREGHQEESSFGAVIEASGFMSATQQLGSARTFAARYAFCDAFGIMTGDEDDDAIKAVKAAFAAPTASPPPPVEGLSREQANQIGAALKAADILAEDDGPWFDGILTYFQVRRLSLVPAKEYDNILKAIKDRVSWVTGEDTSEVNPFGGTP